MIHNIFYIYLINDVPTKLRIKVDICELLKDSHILLNLPNINYFELFISIFNK